MKTKQPVASSDRPVAGEGVLEQERLEPRGRPRELEDPLVPDHFDLGIREQALLQDLRRTELVAPVDDVDLFGVPGQVVGLLDRRVAPADDGDGLALEEGPVAHGAVRHAAAGVLQLAGYLELGGRAAGGEDHGGCLVDRAAGGRDLEHAVVPAGDALDVLLADVGAECGGVRRHLLRQLPPEHVLEARIVVDPLGVEQFATGHAALQQHRLEHAAAGVHGGAEPRGPAADDDQLELLDVPHPVPRRQVG